MNISSQQCSGDWVYVVKEDPPNSPVINIKVISIAAKLTLFMKCDILFGALKSACIQFNYWLFPHYLFGNKTKADLTLEHTIIMYIEQVLNKQGVFGNLIKISCFDPLSLILIILSVWLTRSKVFLSASEFVHAKCTIISIV